MKLEDQLQRIEHALARWHSRLYRAVSAIRKLEQAERRLKDRIAERQAPKPKAPPEPGLNDRLDDIIPPVADDLGIPDFLQRKRDGEMRDKIAADAIRAEQEERKRNKARVRIDTMKAKQSGASKQMPLQGKDALKAIYG